MSKTPRTDAAWVWDWQQSQYENERRQKQCSQTIETELTAANARIAELEAELKYEKIEMMRVEGLAMTLSDLDQQTISELHAELARLKAEGEMMKNTGNEMYASLDHYIRCGINNYKPTPCDCGVSKLYDAWEAVVPPAPLPTPHKAGGEG